MQLVILPLAASLLSLVCAQQGPGPNAFKIPKEGLSLAAGQPTTLTWNPTTPGTVSLFLRSGASSALDQGALIEAGIDNQGTYTFTPPADVVRGSDYTIEIVSDTDDTQVNFTPTLVVESGNTVKSITPLPSSASATLAASSSSSSSLASASSISAKSSSVASVSSVSSSAASSSSAVSSASLASSVPSVSSVRSSATAESTASRASATSGLMASVSRASATSASGTQTASGTSVPTTAAGDNAGTKVYGASSAAAMVILCMLAVW